LTDRDKLKQSIYNKLDNVKFCNLKKKNRDHKKLPKQDKDNGNLQILLHLRSLFQLHGIAFAIVPFATYLHTINHF